ncbi:MAG: DUF21 domain-containing protein [Bdellovibrionales bacterium]|nr:DUF21 domain-containing protein [Bdellovibrionales bacterium]
MSPISILVLSVTLTIIISATCSLMEAALYAVPLPYVKHLAENGSRSGKVLLGFKENMGRPISAILILNTISNTGGASNAGWAGGAVFSETGAIIFSCLFVLAILYCAEIFPKTFGVLYNRQVSLVVAQPLSFLMRFMTPLLLLSEKVSERLKKGGRELPVVSHEEVLSMASIGAEEGALDDLEGEVIANVIGLDQILLRDVLTPRVVVFRMKEESAIESLREEIAEWSFSRVPLYSEEDPDHLTSYVTQRDVYRELLKGDCSLTLRDISRPIHVVPELMRADELLLRMFREKEHICSVVDEHGSLAGIITLEDLLEELLGHEIVDEYDTVSDLRTLAKIMKAIQSRRKKVSEKVDSKHKSSS